jgi:hypothetical protein
MAHQKDYAFRATRFDLLQSQTNERTNTGTIGKKWIWHHRKKEN